MTKPEKIFMWFEALVVVFIVFCGLMVILGN